ncbi:MAG: hypothetical protein ACTSRD_10355 [Promethearchaeota archaeon]
MEKTVSKKLFLIFQICTLIFYLFCMVLYYIVVMIVNAQPHPEDHFRILAILELITISITFLWGLLNTVFAILKRMKIRSCLLFWGFVIGNIVLMIGAWFSFIDNEYVLLSFYFAGWVSFIGFFYSMNWTERFLLVKIPAICAVILMISATILLSFFPYGWIVDTANGVFGFLHVIMLIGSILLLVSKLRKDRTQKS